jgi:hypothetical protein
MVYDANKGGKESSFSCGRHCSMSFLWVLWASGGAVPPPRVWLKPQNKVTNMLKKRILNPERVRCIDGGFSFIPHRFLLEGFLASLNQKEILLYFFLVLASDRNGLSFYSYDHICTLLQFNLDEYIASRGGLIEKDLIAFDGSLFQVLSLPPKQPDRQKRRERSPAEPLIQQVMKGS